MSKFQKLMIVLAVVLIIGLFVWFRMTRGQAPKELVNKFGQGEYIEIKPVSGSSIAKRHFPEDDYTESVEPEEEYEEDEDTDYE